MRVLVTGASGYVGTALVPALEEAAHRVFPASRLMVVTGDGPYARSWVSDAIVHLACDTRGSWGANIRPLPRVMDWLPSGARFVFASTLTAREPLDDYGRPTTIEDRYSREKALAEEIVKARPDIEAVILRLGCVYGPGKQNKRSAFNAILRQIHNGEHVSLYGNCLGRRDCVFIDDVVAAFVQALSVPAGTYDVGTGRGYTLVNATHAACAAGHAQRWPTTDVVGSTAYDLPLADHRRFLPGWKPTVTLEEGIRKTLSYLRENEPARVMVAA